MSADESITSLPEAVKKYGALPVPVGPVSQAPMSVHAASIRLAQYGERASTWSTATYDSGTEKALHEIALTFQARVDEVERAYTFDTAALKARIAELEAQREALAERLRAGQQWRQGRNPELVSENFVSQSELRSIFGIPLVAPWADGLTKVFVPVASLREPEGEHYPHVHHDYRVSHDLPETGGAS